MKWSMNTLVTNFFLRDKYASQKATNIKYFQAVRPLHDGTSCVVKLSIH